MRIPVIIGLAWMGTAIFFFLFSGTQGGAAIHGRIVDGHYFVRSHGSQSEVSRGVFFLSAAASAACGLMLSAFAGATIWHLSLKQKRLPLLVWIAGMFVLTIGVAVFGLSLRCVVGTN